MQKTEDGAAGGQQPEGSSRKEIIVREIAEQLSGISDTWLLQQILDLIKVAR